MNTLVICIVLVLFILDAMILVGGEKGRREVERKAKTNLRVPKKESC